MVVEGSGVEVVERSGVVVVERRGVEVDERKSKSRQCRRDLSICFSTGIGGDSQQ